MPLGALALRVLCRCECNQARVWRHAISQSASEEAPFCGKGASKPLDVRADWLELARAPRCGAAQLRHKPSDIPVTARGFGRHCRMSATRLPAYGKGQQAGERTRGTARQTSEPLTEAAARASGRPRKSVADEPDP